MRLIQKPGRGNNSKEAGVTLALVVVALVVLLAIAALSIDVVTLYVARAEAQRAADAAALAAAKALVDRGVTADPANATLQTTAQSFATIRAQATATQHSIAGQPVNNSEVTVNYAAWAGTSRFGVNPTAQVTVLRTGLPTFFSRIWSSAASTVTATAVAEAYNPSGAKSVTVGTQPSIAVKCVKPWLLPNIDPDGKPGATLFSPGDGSITRPGIVTVPGEIGQPIRLNATLPGTNPTTSGNDLSFYPTDFPAPISPSGPQCWDSGGSRYRQDIETCNPEPVACGDKIKLETGPIATSDTIAGVQCLTNASAVGNDQGQDVLDTSVSRIKFRAGTASPLLPNGVNAGDEISTTGSLVTVPVYDSGAGVAPANPVTVIGFLQLFVDQVDGLGRVHTHLINVSGCGTTAGKPIVAGSVSSVPVRLIRNSN